MAPRVGNGGGARERFAASGSLIVDAQSAALAERSAAVRSQALALHRDGADPLETAGAIAEGCSECVALAWRTAAEEAGVDPNDVGIVAAGSLGRRECAPYSDLDLQIVVTKPNPSVEAAVKTMIRRLWDAGFSLGQNVGDVKTIVEQSRTDAMLATSLLAMRWIAGSDDAARELEAEFAKSIAKGNPRALEESILTLLAEEASKYGNAAQLTEPNVKRSAGGLRFLNGVEWIGRLRTSKPTFEAMEEDGFLAAGDSAALADARRWLLRLRADLHFNAGKAEDVLSRSDQLRIAAEWNYEDAPERLAVEAFMRDVLRRTTTVQEIADDVYFRPVARRSWGRRWLRRKSSDQHAAPPTLEDALQAALDSAQAGKPLSKDWVARIRRHFRPTPNPEPASPQSRRQFLQLLDHPGKLGPTLRLLHQTGLLGRLLPEFEFVRCLIQFNAYHRYTVDEHTLVAVENAERLLDPDRTDLPAVLYRRLPRKGLLHLALLLHDLGKGRAEDHSDVGARIAKEVAERFELSAADREMLVFLVHKHLLLSGLAFHRDSRDPDVVHQLVQAVGREAALQQLFVLTTCDICAVSPEAYTPWKADLLAELYRRAAGWFGDAPQAIAADADKRRRELWASRPAPDSEARLAKLPREIVAGLTLDAWAPLQDAWRSLDETRVAVLPTFDADRQSISLTVLAKADLADGIFFRICGALAAHHLEVLAADVHTLDDGTVLDVFQVRDVHHFGPASPERLQRISATVRRVVTGELAVEDALWSMRSSVFVAGTRVIAADPVRVEIDNDSSQACTVVDVFAMDRRGLLFTLAKTIHQAGLSIEHAKIATYHDEVVDAFYVKDPAGGKVIDESKLTELRAAVVDAVRKLAEDPRSMGF